MLCYNIMRSSSAAVTPLGFVGHTYQVNDSGGKFLTDGGWRCDDDTRHQYAEVLDARFNNPEMSGQHIWPNFSCNFSVFNRLMKGRGIQQRGLRYVGLRSEDLHVSDGHEVIMRIP